MAEPPPLPAARLRRLSQGLRGETGKGHVWWGAQGNWCFRLMEGPGPGKGYLASRGALGACGNGNS